MSEGGGGKTKLIAGGKKWMPKACTLPGFIIDMHGHIGGKDQGADAGIRI